MSLKAYDGMMSRKSIKYIQDGIVERMPKFKDASENKLAKRYAELFITHVDEKGDIRLDIGYEAINCKVSQDAIINVNIDDDTLILSYLFQVSDILSKSSFNNDFSANLNITLDAINNRKILIYPNIIVYEHKQILLEFLEDWYCQDQSDPDVEVDTRQWKQRKKDWYNFNENSGVSMKIKLFDPLSYVDNLNKSFRGDNLINKILKYIPSDDDRIKKIAFQRVGEQIKKSENISGYDIHTRLMMPDNTEIDDYIKNNNIKLTAIDFDFIGTEKFDLLKLERRQKLKSLK